MQRDLTYSKLNETNIGLHNAYVSVFPCKNTEKLQIRNWC